MRLNLMDPSQFSMWPSRVWLENGIRMIGMWTGERWWSTEGEIHPVRWELRVREKKTQKLLKQLPKNERPVRAEDSA